MKRLAVSLAVAGTALMAGQAVNAQDDGYNTNDPTVTVAPPSTIPGGTFTVTVSDCIDGETATFSFQGETKTDTCDGTASVQFDAPATANTYSGTVALDQSDATLPWQITVAAPSVTVSNSAPAAGSTFTVSIPCASPTATVNFNGQSTTVDTSNGTATATLTAPNAAGTASGTITCGTVVGSFSVTVQTPAPGLPATGSSGQGATLTIAGILLLAGVGMFAVTQQRRRRAATIA